MKAAVAKVSEKAAKSVRLGYPWVWRQELVSLPKDLPKGALVDVVDAQQNPLGQAFSASTSPLALRLVSRSLSTEERVDDAFWKRRFELALARRASLVGRDAMRLVHAEADLVPGLIVDRYGPALTLQTLSEGADVRKASWARLLQEVTGASLVVCRDDASGRDFEGLTREVKVLGGEGPTLVEYHEGRSTLSLDLLADSKTGSFLDQLDNHLRAGELGRGRALDTFSYHGGFALALARSCTSVVTVEQDPEAAERARANVARNGHRHVEVVTGNAFDELRRRSDAGEVFDTVVIDPPGLAKRKEGLATARRAYHELNVRAFKLVAPEGLLVTCSCSGKFGRDAFEAMVLEAAADARRTVQILERRGAGLDHPVLPGLPETEYLKAWFLRVL
ncbi:MAG: class I SAM-dependent rRNA methyltransferase [Myxococcaceae bacterium]|nr:class I SAM-dependent rRNA methyltransferase [Myxococcaceae bacterium]